MMARGPRSEHVLPCYILASRRHGALYIGVTNSVQKRLEQHKIGKGSSCCAADCRVVIFDAISSREPVSTSLENA
ncbi:GIY-YIG nuclease family protein [Bradyrhizobium genosp. P]|uniref:GIY-YIG nuclease family protein n=1 Tax=Bradyrhizobium genosp. P TaxID=83641 RepID=UPI003CE73E20